MPAKPGESSLDDLTRRWLDLAERNERHCSELYNSGRWRLYYSAEAFAATLIDAMRAAAAWRRLAGRPPKKPTGDLRPLA